MNLISETNPFVGPQPIQAGQPLFGRTADLRDLYQRLLARRIVLLHSPSGAGKSSLVQAGLLPLLREAGLDPWRAIRVNLDPAAYTGLPGKTNRYLLSTLLCLEDELPEGKRRDPAELAAMSLAAYVADRPRRRGREGQPVVLIFDQFEEMLTADPRDTAQKQVFMSTIGAALEDERTFALFAIREDYLGALSPYRDRVPTQLANTWRLDFLDRNGAREAASELARSGGRSFPAVDRLVRDLSTIQVQQADGSFLPEQGDHVEPVHLQVVCRRLWAEMPSDDDAIDDEDIARFADISQSLGEYYAASVRDIAAGSKATERDLRHWVGSRLIAAGTRVPVMREVSASGGLDNALVAQLLSTYLVRAEPRGGTTWYELSHDRLVAPILENNRAWFQTLDPVQARAQAWEVSGRPAALLLTGDDLARSLAWASEQPDALHPVDDVFLERSRMVELDRATNWKLGTRDRNLFLLMSAIFLILLWQISVYGVVPGTMIPPWKLTVYAGAFLAYGILAAARFRRNLSLTTWRIIQGVLLTTAAVTFHRALYAYDETLLEIPKRTARIMSGDVLIFAVVAAAYAIVLAPWAWRLVPAFLLASLGAHLYPDQAGTLAGVATLINTALFWHGARQAARRTR